MRKILLPTLTTLLLSVPLLATTACTYPEAQSEVKSTGGIASESARIPVTGEAGSGSHAGTDAGSGAGSGAGSAGQSETGGQAVHAGPAKAVANIRNWPEASSPDAIRDAASEQRITQMIAAMSLEQKVGQLVQADISAIKPEDLHNYPLGSLLAGGNSGPYGDERGSAADWDRMVREFRAASLAYSAQGAGPAIPIIFGVDAVHGHNNIPEATIFPHNIGLGAARDVDMIRRIGAATATEISGSGIEWTFAPTLAVPQDQRWGRTYEGYSSDPAIVAQYSSAMVEGLQGDLRAGQTLQPGKVAATAKHFLADGGTTNGKDQGDAAITEDALVAIHAAGYPPAIEAGALTVMASFSSWHGVKNHGNKSLLTHALKQRMGFDGFIVGDWNGHGQVAGCSVTSCAQAINAGLDMFMAPDSWRGVYHSTLEQARKGDIPMERIEDAVRRILRVKFKLGLIDNPMQSRANYGAIGAADHLALAREAVAKSLVLLKNNGSILPIKPGAHVLVSGAGADNLAMQSGGWTISWQGSDVTAADFANGRSIWAGISDAVKAAGGTATLSKDGSLASGTKPDVAIVVFGEAPYAEFQGDVPTLDYQPSGAEDLALIRQLKAQNIPIVSVFLSGRAMFTNPEINASDAFVAAWLPGTQGDGIADVLVADAAGNTRQDFTGTLSYAWPANARAPITAPQWDLGYGLTYAKAQPVPPLPEDPGLDLAKALNVDTYFYAGRTQAPWALSISDAGGKRPVVGSSSDTPTGAVTVRSVDVHAQEDGKAFIWHNAGSMMIEGPPANVWSHYEKGASLQLELRLDNRGDAPVKLVYGDAAVVLDGPLAKAQRGAISTISIPLACFTENRATFENLGNAMRIEADKNFAITLLSAKLDDGSNEASSPHGSACPGS